MCPLEVEEFLLREENRITKTIRNEYGRHKNLTYLWDTSMNEVTRFF